MDNNLHFHNDGRNPVHMHGFQPSRNDEEKESRKSAWRWFLILRILLIKIAFKKFSH